MLVCRLNTIYLYGYNETATRLCETVRCLTREADVTTAILEEYRRDPRRALTDEGVVCLVCGRLFRHLTNTHLRSHGLTSEQYKATFGYNVRRALMVTSLRTVHALNALRADLASWIRRRAILEDPTLRRRGGQRVHRAEERLTRQERGQQQATSARRDQRGRFAVSLPS